MAALRFARYSTFASYLRSNRAAYTTETHTIGEFAAPIGGHRIAKTTCNKKFSDLETHDGNGKVEPYVGQKITCKVCARALSSKR